jgi:hypothetical protein
MEVHFERSGGFAGRKISATIREPIAEELRRLIEAARFFELPRRGTTPARGADRFQYVVTVSDGPKKHEVTVSDATIPESLQPLIDYLSKAATAGGGEPR